jgi:hypothetical protein
MLQALVALSACYESFAFDFGSQFTKIARSTLLFGAVMVPNRNGGVLFPSAAAIKSPKNLTFPLALTDIEEIDLKFGFDALQILKRRPTYGYEFLPRILCRNETGSEFGQPLLTNSTAFFNLLFQHLTHDLLNRPQSIGVVVPAFWTAPQVQSIQSAFDAYKLQLDAIIDEISAFATLYSVQRGGKLSSRHVLVVDVGATSVKAYSILFDPKGTYVAANNSAYVWSESAGTYHFAKCLGAPLRKAQKRLMRATEFNLTELRRVVLAAYRTAISNGGPIDEVQAIGGGSTLRPVLDAIRDECNNTVVRKEFAPQEALVRGAVLATLSRQGIVASLPVRLTRRAVFSMRIICNESTVYCLKGDFCPEEVAVLGGCSTARVIAEDVPEGAEETMVTLNFSAPGNGTGYFRMKAPDPVVTAVRWCQERRCVMAQFKAKYNHSWERESGQFMLPFLQFRDPVAPKKKTSFVPVIKDLLEKLDSLLNPDKDISVEATDGITDEMRRKFLTYSAQFKEGELQKLPEKQLQSIAAELKEIHKTLNYAF